MMDRRRSERACERYQARKAAGLCPVCGKRKPLPGKVLCETCLKHRAENYKRTGKKHDKSVRERRAWLKAHGLCPECGQREPLPGRVYCEECLERNSQKTRERRARLSPEEKEEQAEKRRRQQNERSKKFREAGLCSKCGKHKPLPGRHLCLECTLKARRLRREERRRQGVLPRGDDGCYFCGAERKPGYKVCEKHYKWLVGAAAHMRAAGGNEGLKRINDDYWKLQKAKRGGTQS